MNRREGRRGQDKRGKMKWKGGDVWVKLEQEKDEERRRG